MERLEDGRAQPDARRARAEQTSVPRTPATDGVGPTQNGAIPRSRLQPVHRLFTHRTYFGLDAEAFRAGAGRLLARLPAAAHASHIEFEALRRGFGLGREPARALADALLDGGLLLRVGDGRYRTTALFRQYAHASLAKPLSRRRAKTLIGQACDQAADLNGDSRNPLHIEMIAVSGSYMSRLRELEELTLWLILQRRAQVSRSRWRRPVDAGDGLHRIVSAITELSSFIVVRTAPDKQTVQRPFSIVFQASDDARQPLSSRWNLLCDWTNGLSRRLVIR